MKILVISGFLGAGKTTFMKELISRTKQDFAVMENEYGAIGIDGDLLESADTSLNIWELTEGCICCTRKADFATSILTIANTLDPEYLLVEPTGVGELSKIIDNIQKIQYERISLLSPVVILDGQNFSSSMEKFSHLCTDQLEAAGTIVISKQESAEPEELEALVKQIRRINQHANLCAAHYTKQDDRWWEDLLKQSAGSSFERIGEEEEDSEEVDSVSLTSISLENGNQLILFLQGVVSGVFGDIVRSKGYLNVGNAWLQFNVVNRTYSITGFEAAESSKGIFIGTGLKRNLLREALQKHLYRKPVSVSVSPKRRRLEKKQDEAPRR